MPTRRIFLQQTGIGLAGLLAGPWAMNACAPSSGQSLAHIGGHMQGPNHGLGHLLRGGTSLPEPTRELTADVLIVGGGAAGLSARRWLRRQGIENVLLAELDAQPGGNASHGRNAVSAYPWGAHYLPVPDPNNTELLDFLRETGAVTGFSDGGLPVYNDYHLCYDPQERLLMDGHWQEGLVPKRGVSAEEQAQITRFFALIDTLKAARGNDGRPAFAIPLDRSSTDPQYRQLDSLTFAEYLDQQGFTAPPLRWYLTYACRDDYGAPPETVSAWAGLHYFASRTGRGYSQTGGSISSSDVLTWPEGNGFLLDHLRQSGNSPNPSANDLLVNHLVCDLQTNDRGVRASCYDAVTKQTVAVQARAVLLATPQFITKHLLKQAAPDRAAGVGDLHYAPWLVANVTVDALPQGNGMPLCWDNVGYGTASVGYITANHQDVADQPQRVITLYWPLTDIPPDAARRAAYQTLYGDWLQRVVAELETMHPGVTPHVQQVDVCVWGHGMVAPTPGYVWGAARQQAMKPIDNRIFFAHSDLSGVSIFEEAFYQGIRAGEEISRALATQT